jgi:hypothetical protein
VKSTVTFCNVACGGVTTHAPVGNCISGILDVGVFGGDPGTGDLGRIVVGHCQEISGLSLSGNPELRIGVAGDTVGRDGSPNCAAEFGR